MGKQAQPPSAPKAKCGRDLCGSFRVAFPADSYFTKTASILFTTSYISPIRFDTKCYSPEPPRLLQSISPPPLIEKPPAQPVSPHSTRHAPRHPCFVSPHRSIICNSPNQPTATRAKPCQSAPFPANPCHPSKLQNEPTCPLFQFRDFTFQILPPRQSYQHLDNFPET